MVFYKNTGFGYKDTRFWSFRKDNLHNNFAGCLTFYVCITVKNNVPAHSSLIRWPECEKCFSCYGTSLHLKDPVDIVQKSMRISVVLLSATQSKNIEAELTPIKWNRSSNGVTFRPTMLKYSLPRVLHIERRRRGRRGLRAKKNCRTIRSQIYRSIPSAKIRNFVKIVHKCQNCFPVEYCMMTCQAEMLRS